MKNPFARNTNLEEAAKAKAVKIWKKLGISIPGPYSFTRRGSWDNDLNPQCKVSNYNPEIRQQAPTLVFLRYSAKQKGYWPSEEMVSVSRDGKVDGIEFEINLTMIKGQIPFLWVSNDHAGARIELDGKEIERLRDIFPEFAPYLPEAGKIDLKPSLAALSRLDDQTPMPLVLVKK